MTEDFKYFRNTVAERKALSLFRRILEENSRSLRVEDDTLTVLTRTGVRYFIDLKSAKVYDSSGRFICLGVLSPGLPVIDQVIAKSLYLSSSPRPLAGIAHDLLFKITFVGFEPMIEWPWIKSMALSTLGETFSSLIGVDFAVKRIEVSNYIIKLQMWYVNYADRFKSLGMRYIQGAMGGVVLCTEAADPRKFESLERSITELRSNNQRNLPMIFIGLYDEEHSNYNGSRALKLGEELANRNEIPFFKCALNHPAATEAPLNYLTLMILRRPENSLAR